MKSLLTTTLRSLHPLAQTLQTLHQGRLQETHPSSKHIRSKCSSQLEMDLHRFMAALGNRQLWHPLSCKLSTLWMSQMSSPSSHWSHPFPKLQACSTTSKVSSMPPRRLWANWPEFQLKSSNHTSTFLAVPSFTWTRSVEPIC